MTQENYDNDIELKIHWKSFEAERPIITTLDLARAICAFVFKTKTHPDLWEYTKTVMAHELTKPINSSEEFNNNCGLPDSLVEALQKAHDDTTHHVHIKCSKEVKEVIDKETGKATLVIKPLPLLCSPKKIAQSIWEDIKEHAMGHQVVIELFTLAFGIDTTRAIESMLTPSEPKEITADYILEQCIKILKQRGEQRDSPEGERSAAKVMACFNIMRNQNLPASDFWLIMEICKQVRSCSGKWDMDHYVDGGNYTVLRGEETFKEAKKEGRV